MRSTGAFSPPSTSSLGQKVAMYSSPTKTCRCHDKNRKKGRKKKRKKRKEEEEERRKKRKRKERNKNKKESIKPKVQKDFLVKSVNKRRQ